LFAETEPVPLDPVRKYMPRTGAIPVEELLNAKEYIVFAFIVIADDDDAEA
jgi:hypothetical protein